MKRRHRLKVIWQLLGAAWLLLLLFRSCARFSEDFFFHIETQQKNVVSPSNFLSLFAYILSSPTLLSRSKIFPVLFFFLCLCSALKNYIIIAEKINTFFLGKSTYLNLKAENGNMWPDHWKHFIPEMAFNKTQMLTILKIQTIATNLCWITFVFKGRFMYVRERKFVYFFGCTWNALDSYMYSIKL